MAVANCTTRILLPRMFMGPKLLLQGRCFEGVARTVGSVHSRLHGHCFLPHFRPNGKKNFRVLSLVLISAELLTC